MRVASARGNALGLGADMVAKVVVYGKKENEKELETSRRV